MPSGFDRERSITIWHRPNQREKVAPESRVNSGEIKPGLGLTLVCSGANLLTTVPPKKGGVLKKVKSTFAL